ncbi:MAG TPA: hypothetical protein DIU00_07300 [Phycisphaerales bacterium]|nr:hypothetical protein [Phycisphaerales bacterium]
MDAVHTISKATETETGLLFGELLVSKGLLNQDELQEVLDIQREQGGRFGEVLLRLKKLDDKEVTAALADHFSMEYIHFDDANKLDRIDINIARMLPEGIAKRFCLVAIDEDDNNNIVIVMADPLNVVAIDTVTLKLKRQIKPAISSAREIRRAIELIYHGSDVEEEQLRNLVEIEVGAENKQDDDVLLEDIVEPDAIGEDAANKAPVIRFVDLLMSQAVKCRASDIHIEPQEKSTVVRMRVDGILRDMVPPAKKMQAAVIARIKIVARHGHSRAQAAAGRPVQNENFRQGHRRPRFDDSNDIRRKSRDANPGRIGGKARPGYAWARTRTPQRVERKAATAPRHHNCHRADRQRQKYHVVLGTEPPEGSDEKYNNG